MDFSRAELEEIRRSLQQHARNYERCIGEFTDDPDWRDWQDYLAATNRALLKVELNLLEGTRIEVGQGWRRPGSDDA